MKINKLLKIIALLIITLTITVFIAIKLLSKPYPEIIIQEKNQAINMAHNMQKWTKNDCWKETPIIQWSFMDMHHYIWDKKHNLCQIKWKNYDVRLDLTSLKGKVYKKGEEIENKKTKDKLIHTAWTYWCNDAFWLNPIAKIFDEGVELNVATLKNGTKGLLVKYTNGGVTPGDSYFWVLDEKNKPTDWYMWVNILPIKGLHTSWGGWVLTSTGAKISTKHQSGPINIKMINNLRTAENLRELNQAGLFSNLEISTTQ